MRKLLLLFTLALGVVAFSSCSGEKGNSEKTQEEVAEAAKDTDFDIEGLKAITEKEKSEITEDDFDFLLEQAEILAEQTKGMTKKQKQDYFAKLGTEKGGAVMVIAFSLDAGKKSGMMTPDQIKRYEEISQE